MTLSVAPAQPAPSVLPPLPRASRQPRPESHVLALEEVKVHGLERMVVLGTAVAFLALLVWAFLTRVPEIAVGLGEMAPAAAPAPVQHLEGGIVSAVLVEEGDLVTPGQPILRMSGATADTELRQARLRLESLQLQAQRLAAAAEGSAVAMPLPSTGVFVAPQRAALEARLRALADKRAVLREQAAQRRNDLTTLEGQVRALDRQVALHSRELVTREELARRGLTTRIAVLEARRMLMGAAAERDRLAGQHVSTQRALAEVDARIVELQSTAADEARQEAARVALETAETAEAVRRLEDRAERTVLRAPIGGILRGLAVHRAGTVVPPGGVVAEIMPQDAPLVADVRLSPRDIGFIAAGQPVNLKVQAFDYARFGTVSGQVERISAGTFLDEQKQPHYRARIALSQQHVGQDPRLARLTAGMTVQADITTGAKTVLQYLLKPIYSAMAASFHER
ncbi:HlyD family type I secretion periplasmic adaptor subunit [Teichococcus vastitatis]|uniref:Membrane fusion protein (MFP) family protein n=1 Tax=Teichococcus vastitatis TaxID=2307076 RepID=A0ABS9W696_9PROT|nr:HlyD family type I secretion periplasmic adaptor subunit [Pseudoroseomonas vastitatis]MCI0754819.1 HlyD family type I secretion periplasmic adaptor subunit [Pseudoroseomonas vastitatis]